MQALMRRDSTYALRYLASAFPAEHGSIPKIARVSAKSRQAAKLRAACRQGNARRRKKYRVGRKSAFARGNQK